MSGHTWNLGVIWLLLAACDGAQPQAAAPKTSPAAPTSAPAAVEPAPARAPTGPAVKLADIRDDVPLPLRKILGRPVLEVQALLGEHLGKGMMRSTCIRFVPERTFYSCRYAQQRYADRTDNFKSVQLEYEDGVATGVAFDGWKHGGGAFDPETLLTAIGLTLPEAGEESSPAADVRLWRWFNHKSRLVLGDQQYRVEASIVGEDWSRSRVEVILNHPLTDAQKAKIVQPSTGSAVSETPASTPAP